ncbi:MAG: PASTA domain-containing protein [Bacteroidales bacterium]|nr:PASTA domain-containing protein [Bacteroidales bacterium]
MKNFLKIVGINVVIMIALVAVILYGLTYWLNSYTRHNESIKVPEVVGLSDDEAIYYLEKAGLKPMIIDSLYADAVPGSVIEQLPEGGLPVKNGRIVYLTINAKTVRMIKMVEVLDHSTRQARSLLNEAGFVVDSIQLEPYEFDDLVLDVRVGNSKALPGEKYPIRTHVTLVVGSTQVEINPENDESEEVFFE